MLALLLGGAGFLGSPAWAAEIKGFSSEAAKNAGPQYGGTLTFWKDGGQGPPNSWDPLHFAVVPSGGHESLKLICFEEKKT